MFGAMYEKVRGTGPFLEGPEEEQRLYVQFWRSGGQDGRNPLRRVQLGTDVVSERTVTKKPACGHCCSRLCMAISGRGGWR